MHAVYAEIITELLYLLYKCTLNYLYEESVNLESVPTI